MKLLIFSDTHLTEKKEPNKLKLLKKIINWADEIIINGDFWDGYKTDFYNFYNSDWKVLFPQLKKKAYYNWGNHDHKLLTKEKVKNFCKHYQKTTTIKSGNLTIKTEHGNRLLPLFDETNNYDIKDIRQKKTLKILQMFIDLFFNLNIDIFKNTYFRYKTIQLKHKIKPRKNFLYAFGHTHYPMLDLKNSFANSGFINYGFASFITVEEGKVKLHQTRY
ncbi:MAG: hypothetical protein KatS3mg090_0341 [Patescibacteria group bacterium]|nr:MAG: hypothetical protein KatS3mg090_0341 [Patescibacteria group bacterium]